MQRRFVNDVQGKFKAPLKDDDGRTVAYLLWGDAVRVVAESGQQAKVKARAREGWVPKSVLGTEGLLEVYVIDVGQGDAVLLRTPDDAWHLVDAGVPAAQQMTKKGAANFVRWKFVDDLGRGKVQLENVIVSHPDFDHYGGLLDLLAGRLHDGRTFPVEVANLYHSGMGRFAAAPKLGRTASGSVAPLPYPDYGVPESDDFITELLDGRGSFADPPRPLDPSFARLAMLVATVPNKVRRLSAQDAHLPGYEPGAGAVTIRVLGPVVEAFGGGKRGLRVLGSESVTRNGHSIVLRVDYGKARLVLTGDLNSASQRLLLSYADSLEFAADLAKGCHHGSDDVDLRFVRAKQARATVVSSGDNEDYAHPRPRVLGASARYGRESKSTRGELLPPLLYSTELARSVELCEARAVREAGTTREIAAADAEIRSTERGASFGPLARVPLAVDLIYGLINVRTDGTRILCAYMKEQTQDFDVQAFRAGVEP
jgi:beta-lactamase superfamily II metal-dependent hydrolase